jgi:hypothetical protein
MQLIVEVRGAFQGGPVIACSVSGALSSPAPKGDSNPGFANRRNDLREKGHEPMMLKSAEVLARKRFSYSPCGGTRKLVYPFDRKFRTPNRLEVYPSVA